ncbi:hypothetical protein SLS62_000707 [Diatrype stigma]|uniref:RING-type domain-containing protein n=1 Tax=Diatrype stigma TaxID=117547 RepID=A0AAN9YSB7_9PEZI
MSAADQTAAAAASSSPAVVIDTNNFHQVLKHFDADGQLLADEARTEIAIPCSICTKNLAIPCRGADITDETHEAFAVLPCGHGFGFVCLCAWLAKSQWDHRFQGQGDGRDPFRPQCPACRQPAPVVPGTRRVFRLPPLFLARDRADDMRRVRAALRPYADGEGKVEGECEGKDGGSVVAPYSIRSILSERDDPGTFPVAERTVLMLNWAQLGTDDELAAFLTASFGDATFAFVEGQLWMYKKGGDGGQDNGSGGAEQEGPHHPPRREPVMGIRVSNFAVDYSGGQPVVGIKTEGSMELVGWRTVE